MIITDPIYQALCMSYSKENIKVENKGGNTKIGFVFDFNTFKKSLIDLEIENYEKVIDNVYEVLKPIINQFMLNISSDLMYNHVDSTLEEKVIQSQWNTIIQFTDLPLPDYIYENIK